MTEALARAQAEIEASFATARASRVERRVGDVTLVVAVCDGHPSEIADAWGKESQNAVFALYDAKSLAVSLRRSPDCTVDLSRVAGSLGGGGHAAASGCQLPELRRVLAEAVAERVAEKLP
jgi:nanoRNase/pAp phosphatase (c-di-AMP/oligoRNAs hydrolase)